MQTWWQCQTCNHTQNVRASHCDGCEVDHLRPGCRTVRAMNLGDAVDRFMVIRKSLPHLPEPPDDDRDIREAHKCSHE